jgi:hypothetical protein
VATPVSEMQEAPKKRGRKPKEVAQNAIVTAITENKPATKVNTSSPKSVQFTLDLDF